MSTVVSPNCNSETPFVRLPVRVNLSAAYDETEKRYKSGRWKVQITNVTWAGTEEADELVKLVVQPYNYNPGCNEKATYAPLTSADAWGGSTFTHVTAVNYGQPDPSAKVEDDGTVTLAVVDFTLPRGTTSDVVVTVTYTAVFTAYDVYTANSSTGTAYTGTVEVKDTKDEAWGLVNLASGTGPRAIWLQLQSMATDVCEKFPPGQSPANFQYANVPLKAGTKLANGVIPVPKSAARTRTFEKYFSYVFAVNNGKVDANATLVVDGVTSGGVYHLCSYGLAKSSLSNDVTAATLGYRLFTETV